MKKALYVFVLLAVGIQFYRPERSNPTQDESINIMSKVQMSEEVVGLLQRACMDCHSYSTKWPWYSHVAPVMWIVAKDVKEGRRHLNLSEWGNYTKGKQAKKLFQIAEVVSEGEMPLNIYVRMHPEAVLTEMERKRLSEWAEEQAEGIGDVPDEEGPHNEKNNPKP
ncbi:MAG: heme-binding domain-containing protein [Bacteroidetes bacterium]|nr:heme-binding domain-containing protein [Bacteroidota bacterium]